jgi:integrase
MKKDNTYPVKLLVTFERTPQRYQTIYDLTQKEFDAISSPRVSDKLQKVRDDLKLIKREAEEVVNTLTPFSFKGFEKAYIYNNAHFKQRKHIRKAITASEEMDSFDFSPFFKRFPIVKETDLEPNTIGFTFQNYIRQLLKAGRIGTAANYYSGYISLKKYGGNLRFTEITVDFLRSYEQWMKGKNSSKTTIGIYLRALRAMFNEADANGIINNEHCYPFGRRKYLIPSSRNIKKALELSHIKKIYYYQPTCESEAQARDYWLFLYFGNGMNTKDMALLKYKNIEGEYLVFERAKTEWSTRTDPKIISVFMSDDILKIIDRWGNKDKSPENYIFPILSAGISPLREYELIQLFTAFINDWMKKIGEHFNIPKKVTTYVARHTFSTVMKRSGTSTEFIQEALGHADLKTTENYLDSFENEVKKAFAGKLVAFKKKPKRRSRN